MATGGPKSNPETMDDNFPLCRSIGVYYREDRPEDDTINIDKKQLEEIKDLLNSDEFRLYPAIFCAILSDELYFSEARSVLETFRKILIKYHCHVCHKEIIIALLTVVNMEYLKKLYQCRRFVIGVIENLYLNRQIVSQEIAALSSEIYSKLPYIFSHELIFGISNLEKVLELLIATYGPQWSIYGKNDLQVYKIMTTALEIYKYVTAVHHDERLTNYYPDERVQIGLVCAFEFNPHIVMTIASNIIKSIRPGYRKESEAWLFYDNFTMLLFNKKTWNKSSYHAVRYVETISELNDTLFTKFSHFNSAIRIHSKLNQNVSNMLVAARQLKTHETLDLYDIIIRQVSDVVYELNLVDDLFDLFHNTIQRILSEVRSEFEHKIKIVSSPGESPCDMYYKYKIGPDTFRPKQRQESQDEGYANLTSRIFEAIFDLLNKGVVRRFDLRFFETLINIGRHDKMYFFGKRILDLLRVILAFNELSKMYVLDTTIPKAIFDVINSFHIDCTYCAVGSKVTEQLRKLLIPTYVESVTLAEHCTLQQAKSLTYVLHDQYNLVESMHPAGFALLMEQFCLGKCIENLFMISQTFRKRRPPEPILPTAFEKLHRPVKDTDDTRIFVLDDGSKIRTDISNLVKNSTFFSNLFDGRFCESSLKEIPIHEVTEFQFQFLVNYSNCEQLQENIMVWDKIDLEGHMDLIIFLDRMSMPGLCRQLVYSLKCTCLTAEVLPTVFEVGATYGIQCLIQGCMDYALAGDICPEQKYKFLHERFDETSDKEVLAGYVNQWILRECNRVYRSAACRYARNFEKAKKIFQSTGICYHRNLNRFLAPED